MVTYHYEENVLKMKNESGKIRAAVIWVILLFLLGVGIIIWFSVRPSKAPDNTQTPVQDTSNTTQSTVLGDLAKYVSVDSVNGTVTIDSQLKVNNGVTFTPTNTPTNPVAGQMYYDKVQNILFYFNGDKFIPVKEPSETQPAANHGNTTIIRQTPVNNVTNISNSYPTYQTIINNSGAAGVMSLQGQTGDLTLSAGTGISIAGLTIDNTGTISVGGLSGAVGLGAGLSTSGSNLVNSGVLSIAGISGGVTLGNGLSMSGSALQNTGVLTLASGSANLNVTDDGNGNYTVSDTSTGNVDTLGGTTGRIAKFTGSNSIGDSLLSETGTTVTVNGTLAANTITPTAAMTVGSTTQNLTLQGSNTTLSSTSGANTSSLVFQSPGANVTYRLLTAAAGTYDVCTTAGNCASGGTTLQTAYDAGNTITTSDGRNIVFNAADTLTDANILMNLQCVTTCNALTGRFAVQNSGTDVFTIRPNGGSALFKNSTNTTTGFQIQNTVGTAILNVDTVNGRVGVLTTTPATDMEVNGALRLSGTGTDVYSTPTGANVNTKLAITGFTPGAFGQLVALGLTSSAPASARAVSIFDARTVTHQPTLGVFNPIEGDLVGFSWDGSNTTAAVKTAGNSNLSLRTNGTNDALLLTGSNGAATFKNQTNSATGFVIQNSAASNLFVVDTSSSTIKIGGGDVSPSATPVLLVQDYKNTTGDPTGTNGGSYYNSTDGKMRCFENNGWKDCAGGSMGYAEVTADQGSITTEATLTGLSSTITSTANQRLKITARIKAQSTGAGDELVLRIKEGATTLQETYSTTVAANRNGELIISAIIKPSAAAHTYTATLERSTGAGTATMTASATSPAYILVEDIGQ